MTEFIVLRAEGNAFYVEELIKMLIDDGVIEAPHGQPWRIHPERMDPARVPMTLTGVLQTRLDGLQASERIVLQRSSVIGRVIWDGAVASLGDGRPVTPASSCSRRRDVPVHGRLGERRGLQHRECTQPARHVGAPPRTPTDVACRCRGPPCR